MLAGGEGVTKLTPAGTKPFETLAPNRLTTLSLRAKDRKRAKSKRAAKRMAAERRQTALRRYREAWRSWYGVATTQKPE